jgi:hypothetical protein
MGSIREAGILWAMQKLAEHDLAHRLSQSADRLLDIRRKAGTIKTTPKKPPAESMMAVADKLKKMRETPHAR